MALNSAFYVVTKDIAQRAGLVGRRYKTVDGSYILDNKDLSRVRFTPDEYVSGLQGVVRISEQEAKTMIADGGYTMNDFGYSQSNVEMADESVEVETDEPMLSASDEEEAETENDE